MLLDRVLPLPSATGVEAACKWVLMQRRREFREVRAGEESPEGWTRRSSDYSRPWLRVLVALGELLALGSSTYSGSEPSEEFR